MTRAGVKPPNRYELIRRKKRRFQEKKGKNDQDKDEKKDEKIKPIMARLWPRTPGSRRTAAAA